MELKAMQYNIQFLSKKSDNLDYILNTENYVIVCLSGKKASKILNFNIAVVGWPLVFVNTSNSS